MKQDIFQKSYTSSFLSQQYGVLRTELIKYHQKAKDLGLSKDIQELFRHSEQEIQRLSEANKDLINLFTLYTSELCCLIDYSYIIFLADLSGTVLSVYGSSDAVFQADKNNIGVGMSFSFKHTGTSAISIAMENKRNVHLQGSDHYLDIFEDWSCLCIPIHNLVGEVVAFIDFSTSIEIPLPVFYPLLSYIACKMEDEIKNTRKSLVHVSKTNPKEMSRSLTTMEQEVLLLISLEKTNEDIAYQLNIGRRTVEYHISSILRKFNVNSRLGAVVEGIKKGILPSIV